MRRVGFVILVGIGSLAAQNTPPPPLAEPPRLSIPNTSPSQVCVIPLLNAKVADPKQFTLRVIVKSDSPDPKFVRKSPIPSCKEVAGAALGPENEAEPPK
jgi:hypothetical protein